MADAPEVVSQPPMYEKDSRDRTLQNGKRWHDTQTRSDDQPGEMHEHQSLSHTHERDSRAGSGLEAVGQDRRGRDATNTVDGKAEKEFNTKRDMTTVPIREERSIEDTTLQQSTLERSTSAVPRRPALTNGWKYSFWEFWKPGGGCVEATILPCILAGRTHARLHSSDPYHAPSVNLYCCGCFSLGIFMIVGLPCCIIMTSAQRREIRYRYNIKGTNLGDCCRTTFCCCCALMQEEKEMQWHLNAERKREGHGMQMPQRQERMEYSPRG